MDKDFNISGNLGAAIQESSYETSDEDANGLNKSNFFFMTNARSPIVANGYGRAPQVQSLYATATLGYRNYLYSRCYRKK